jgi:hypothetical protein
MNRDPNYDYDYGYDTHYHGDEPMEPGNVEPPTMDEMVAMMERDEWEVEG